MVKLDEEKVLIKIDQMEGYLTELKGVLPEKYESYEETEKRRSTERLLQLTIETVIDICNLMVSGLGLGLPAEENDLFDKLTEEGVITEKMKEKLYRMRGFRNILVHEYASIDDQLVFQTAKENREDFQEFSQQIRDSLGQ